MNFIVKAREKNENALRKRYGDKYIDLILGFAKKNGGTIKLNSLESILRLMELRKKLINIKKDEE